MKIEPNEFCPCCGYNTFEKKERLNYLICPICFWEDDPVQFADPDFIGGANSVSLTQARKNFEMFRACRKEMIKNTRQPSESEFRKI